MLKTRHIILILYLHTLYNLKFVKTSISYYQKLFYNFFTLEIYNILQIGFANSAWADVTFLRIYSTFECTGRGCLFHMSW